MNKIPTRAPAKKTVPAMPGLQQLTTNQVLKLDALIRSVCVYTDSNPDEEVILPLVIRNGKPIKVGRPLTMSKFSPTEL
jgi:hypothetical protein